MMHKSPTLEELMGLIGISSILAQGDDAVSICIFTRFDSSVNKYWDLADSKVTHCLLLCLPSLPTPLSLCTSWPL